MIFNIKWGLMENLITKQFGTEKESLTPTLYFETETSYIFYVENSVGNIWCSERIKEQIEDLNGFRMMYIAKSVELTQPLKDVAFVIKQE